MHEDDVKKFADLKYHSGFGNLVCSEALPGALPVGQNSPQICPYGLYAEQLSGSAFTAPRHKNLKTWLYRIRPSVLHEKMARMEQQPFLQAYADLEVDPNQLRWSPYPVPADNEPIDFIQGLQLYAAAGDVSMKEGLGIYMYAFNQPMLQTAFSNADGDLLLIPQQGVLGIETEMGCMTIRPTEICVIPRGIKMRVVNLEGLACRGYCCELFKGHLELPGLGPLGANGLANARDFQVPVARYEDRDAGNQAGLFSYNVIVKFQHTLYSSPLTHSPFDVVAYHGAYLPFKYDLSVFNVINTVSFDHPDPSIFTVLTAASDEGPGCPILDFVIFPPRYMVSMRSFRPPYFHRNIMSEFMG
ncbi:homogentisate 1,2-dioxygenase, partial [archaeon]